LLSHQPSTKSAHERRHFIAANELLARAIGSKPERHPFGADFKIDAAAMSELGE
jgi:2,3-bisphosphoglycerate-independent phosphoglycerate mutase